MTPYHRNMRRMRWALVIAVSLAMLCVPGESLAISLAPPGKSGADQYFETIPSSGGNVAPPAGGPSTPAGNHALSRLGHGRAGAAKLNRLGKQGQAAAAFAANTAPTRAAPGVASSALGGNPTGPAPVTAAPTSQSQSPASALAGALTGSDSGGLGLILPLLLATALIAAVGVGVGRLEARRRAEPPDATA
jgi:hypothetical protein